MKRIIPLYIIKEILPSFLVNLLVFTFILLMGKVLQITDLVVVRGVKTGTIALLLGLNLPFFLSLTIPMSTLLAVLMTFLRLSGDNEITVMRSSGISLLQLMPPVALFCLWAYLLTSYLTLDVVPAANWAFRVELLNLAKTRADVGIRERVFNLGFKKMVLFVNHMSLHSDLMQDVFIHDDRDPEVVSVIVATQGRIVTDPERGALILQLFNGTIDRVHRNLERTETIDFQRYELRADLEGELGKPENLSKNQSELSTDELWATAHELREKGDRRYPVYLMDAHKRFSVPVACLVLGLVAVPLGVQFRVRGRNWGITIGLAVFLVYYVLLTAGWSLGKTGSFSPAWGMWLPNLVVGAAGIFWLRQADRSGPHGPAAWVAALKEWLARFGNSRRPGGNA